MRPRALKEQRRSKPDNPMIRYLSAIFLGFCFLVPAPAQSSKPPESRKSENVSPGIEHIEIRRGDFSKDTAADRWTINLLVVDPEAVRLKLGQAMDEVAGAETTTSLAARHNAIAAVNGGYFRTTGPARGEPVGVLAINGMVLSEPVRNRASLAVRNDPNGISLGFAHFSLAAHLLVNGKISREINGLNRPRDPKDQQDLVVFTPEFHRTTLTDPDGVEITVVNGQVTSISDLSGSSPIPHNGFVVSAGGKARDWALINLKRGVRLAVKLDLKADPVIAFKPDYILGGGPQLIAGNKPVIQAEEKAYAESFFRARHPRTAIGRRADGKIVMVVVDGRQPKKSVGMTIEELAGLMSELGCVEALNLDGGGSSTMVIRNKIVNNPSDATGERPVSDALMIVAR